MQRTHVGSVFEFGERFMMLFPKFPSPARLRYPGDIVCPQSCNCKKMQNVKMCLVFIDTKTKVGFVFLFCVKTLNVILYGGKLRKKVLERKQSRKQLSSCVCESCARAFVRVCVCVWVLVKVWIPCCLPYYYDLPLTWQLDASSWMLIFFFLRSGGRLSP